MNDNSGFLDRTLFKVRRAWGGIAGSAFDAVTASLHPDLPEKAAESLYVQMRSCLEPRGGEVSARARAAALGQAYLVLNGTGRERFLKVLAERFDVDHDAVDSAVENLGQARGMDARRLAEQTLAKALEAPRVRLLTQFNALPDGVKFLVDLRAELIPLARRDPALKAMEGEIMALLTTWFDVDFLELRRITWDTASAALLEKLIAYEAVHAIESWDDLKNRLDSDRRCFAYFHPRMPDEPLIFVEVALVNGMAGNVQALLDETAPVLDPGAADTAIFYSISNAQKGLAGIGFGNFLIKRVVDNLAPELKGLKTFATLSPVPGFGAWLDGALGSGDSELLKSGERKALLAASGREKGAKGALKELLARPDWYADKAVAKALKPPLMRLSARYLITERTRGERVKDRVAHFHLSNGARLDRINWLADTSASGLKRSAGIMVNYVYDPGEIDDNHETYTSSGMIAASSSVRGLL